MTESLAKEAMELMDKVSECIDKAKEIGRQEGRQEVVEWCELHNLKFPTTTIPSGDPIDIWLRDSQEWQVQVKDWLEIK